MKRIIVALSLAILAVPALAANSGADQNQRTEQQSGYFDPSA
jgi:hypothetical protein